MMRNVVQLPDAEATVIENIAEAVKRAVETLKPAGGIVVVNQLVVQVNYADGGGASVIVKND